MPYVRAFIRNPAYVPPPTLAPPYCRVQFLVSHGTGKLDSVVLWYRPSGTFSLSFDPQACARAFTVALDANFNTLRGSDSKVQGSNILINIGGVTRSGFDSDDIASSNVITSLPQPLAMCVRLETNQPGRTGQGRVFVPSMGSQYLVADLFYFSGPDAVTLAAMLTDFKGPVTNQGITFELCVKSRKLAQLFTVTGLAFDPTPATQRRRLLRR